MFATAKKKPTAKVITDPTAELEAAQQRLADLQSQKRENQQAIDVELGAIRTDAVARDNPDHATAVGLVETGEWNESETTDRHRTYANLRKRRAILQEATILAERRLRSAESAAARAKRDELLTRYRPLIKLAVEKLESSEQALIDLYRFHEELEASGLPLLGVLGAVPLRGFTVVGEGGKLAIEPIRELIREAREAGHL